MLIKVARVTNPKNVLVQIPGFVVNKWDLKEGDGVEVIVNEESILLVPRKRQHVISERRRPNEVS